MAIPRLTSPSRPLKIFEVPSVLCRHLLCVLLYIGIQLGVGFKTLRIPWIPNRRNDGPTMPFLVHGSPVDILEKGMSLNLGGTARNITQPAGAIDGAELADDILCGVANGWFFGKRNRSLEDSSAGLAICLGIGLNQEMGRGDELLVNFKGVTMPERWVAGEEFVYEDA